jgi:importin subunit beta-1
MHISLELLNSASSKSAVPDTVFTVIGALANALEDGFQPYMEAFTPFLFKGLENQEEPALCSMAIGLVSDITRALGDKVQPWCDDFMNRLLSDLQVSGLLGALEDERSRLTWRRAQLWGSNSSQLFSSALVT